MPKRPQKSRDTQQQQQQPVEPDHPDAKPEPGLAGSAAIATLEKHKSKVMILTVVAAVAICVALVIREVSKQKHSAAAQAYTEAATERSLEKLDAVVSKHTGSVPAGNALLTKSEIQLSVDNTEDARITLLAFIDKYQGHPRHAQGLFALGNIHHLSGDAKAATDYYQRALAAEPDSDIGPLIVIRQGDLAAAEAESLSDAGKAEEAQAKKDEARALYEDSIQRMNFRSNRFIPMAEEKIDLLAIGDVPVVPAPPEPEPEPEVTPAPKPDLPPVDPPKVKPDAPKGSGPAGDAPATKPKQKPSGDSPAPKSKGKGKAEAKAKKPKKDAGQPAPKDQPKGDSKPEKPAKKADAPKPDQPEKPAEPKPE